MNEKCHTCFYSDKFRYNGDFYIECHKYAPRNIHEINKHCKSIWPIVGKSFGLSGEFGRLEDIYKNTIEYCGEWKERNNIL